MVWDTEPDQLCVPATISQICLWRPAKPRSGLEIFATILHGFHNLFTGIFLQVSVRDLIYRWYSILGSI
jgi:hypothetical protein